MANRHFGKIADVWKHAALAEVLELEPPGRYAETHAGSGAYAVVHDREREFGILRFLEVAPRFAVLARSPYRAIAGSYVNGDRGLYPGSALLAMTMLGDASSYLLCDLDRESVTDLRRWSSELGLRSCEVAETDGMAAVAAWLDREARGPGLVHIDPFDPDARDPGGYSALELAARVADSGTGLVYWYGYDEPGDQAWALKKLATLTGAHLWCGDVLVTGASNVPGDLGRATTAGTGFGVILANVRAETAGACAALGNALSDAYADAIFPDGSPGNLAFTTSTCGMRLVSGGSATSEVVVRDYAEGDYGACRLLWAELTEYHRGIYGDPSIGGDDPGAAFDGYLAESRRVGSWVADRHGRVLGLTGLFDRGTSGEVEPVVVAEAARDQGIGRMLISRVVEEARSRGYEYLAIRPVARNVAAVRRFHAAGFRTLGGHIDLTMDLAPRRHEWLPGGSLHGLDFTY